MSPSEHALRLLVTLTRLNRRPGITVDPVALARLRTTATQQQGRVWT